jgi:hypothetical protein
MQDQRTGRHSDFCWACDRYVAHLYRENTCRTCGAPPWGGTVIPEHHGGTGVYILAAECGLWKVGYSQSAQRRVLSIIQQAAYYDVRVRYVACLAGADRTIEQWLHKTFAQTHDAHSATAECLPHPTEWFWPDPGLNALARGDCLAYFFQPEYFTFDGQERP